MAALCNRAGHYIFPLWFLSSSSIFLFPRLISAAANWMYTILPHMVWPQCEFRMQEAKNRHFGTIAQLCRAISISALWASAKLRHWTEGATYIRQGGHHVGHWPTFQVLSASHHRGLNGTINWPRAVRPITLSHSMRTIYILHRRSTPAVFVPIRRPVTYIGGSSSFARKPRKRTGRFLADQKNRYAQLIRKTRNPDLCIHIRYVISATPCRRFLVLHDTDILMSIK